MSGGALRGAGNVGCVGVEDLLDGLPEVSGCFRWCTVCVFGCKCAYEGNGFGAWSTMIFHDEGVDILVVSGAFSLCFRSGRMAIVACSGVL